MTLTDEERVESAKYRGRSSRPRVFEEERFLFPESYGVNRVRLLVRDPEYLFAYWDVDPEVWGSLRRDVGDRALVLSHLTLKLCSAVGSQMESVLLPYGARSWYFKVPSLAGSYRAELGVTLPSGEFRSLAESNTVTTPRLGPSPFAAHRLFRFEPSVASQTARPEGPRVATARDATPPGSGPDPGEGHGLTALPFRPPGRSAEGADTLTEGHAPERGGASDLYRR